MRAAALVALAAAGLACERLPEPPGEAAAASAEDALPCPPRRTVAIRLRLEGAPPAASARLAALEAWADGAPVAVSRVADPVVLAGSGAALLGTIDLPRRARRVAVSISVAPDGAGSCSAPIRFEAEARALERRCEAVVALDAARSIVALEDGTRQLLPQFSVAY